MIGNGIAGRGTDVCSVRREEEEEEGMNTTGTAGAGHIIRS